ncbi:MAG: hypothetical protein AB1476_00645 [Candidatus Hadarchaeota archaeon]
MRELGQKGAATALTALLVLSIMTPPLASVVTADEGGDSKNEQSEITVPAGKTGGTDEHGEEERTAEIRGSENEVEIEARNPDETRAGEYSEQHTIRMRIDEGVKFKLEYDDLQATTENANLKAELEFEVKFEEIVEFVDNDGDGLYDKGEEVYTYDLKNTTFSPIQRTTENVGTTTVHKIVARTADNVFKVTVYASGTSIIVGGDNVKPNEIKIDIEINNYPYTRSDSKLALKTELDSEFEVEEEKRDVEGEDEDEVKVKLGDYSGFFSWKDTALVDGVSRLVKSTNISGDAEEGDRDIYLIYERGTSIVHDPKIGVLGSTGAGLAQVMPWFTVLVAAIFAALLSIVATKYIVIRRSG